MKEFFSSRKPPVESVWNRDLRKWAEIAGVNPYGISAKTTRKTLESWMIAGGMVESTVCLRQGHTNLVSIETLSRACIWMIELRILKNS